MIHFKSITYKQGKFAIEQSPNYEIFKFLIFVKMKKIPLFAASYKSKDRCQNHCIFRKNLSQCSN